MDGAHGYGTVLGDPGGVVSRAVRFVAGPDLLGVRARLFAVEILGAAGICAVIAAVGTIAGINRKGNQ